MMILATGTHCFHYTHFLLLYQPCFHFLFLGDFVEAIRLIAAASAVPVDDDNDDESPTGRIDRRWSSILSP